MSLATGSVIGGPGEAANRIRFNTGPGVNVSGTGHDVRENAIDSNGGLGIDLGGDGVTANDPGDGDTGANEQQNYPVITNAIVSGSSVFVSGTFNGAPGTTVTIRLFQSASCDASDFGEGAAPLQGGTFDITTNVDGNASFGQLFSDSVPPGSQITGTATGPGGNTSEFSACRAVNLG